MDWTIKGGIFVFGLMCSLWFIFLIGFVAYWQKATIFLTDENVQNYVSDWEGNRAAADWVTFSLLHLIMWQIFLMMRKKVAHGPITQGRKFTEWRS